VSDNLRDGYLTTADAQQVRRAAATSPFGRR
jgi:hypothetical protein